MRLRSLLFVPGDRPDRMEKALSSGADALILDLEDAVTPAARPEARKIITDFLGRTERTTKLFVRVNPLDGHDTDADLDAIAKARPDGIVFPKAEGAASVQALLAKMAARGIDAPLLPIATETPAAIFQLGSYAAVAGRSPDGLPRFEDGLRAVRITDAVIDSAESGTWIEMGTDR